MTTDQLVERVLLIHPELSKEELSEKLEREKRKSHGLISDATLLRMVAAELGVETQTIETSTPTLSIADLVPHLNNVTVTGRVVAVFSTKAFNGNRSGKLASFLIADKSSLLRVVLWNDKTGLIESGMIKVGQIVRVVHGYTKEDNSSRVELHVGGKSKVEINPKEAETTAYPTISKFTVRIGEITQSHKNKKVNIRGTIKRQSTVTPFERQDSTTGKVMRLVMADESGEITLVAWNGKVDELQENLKKGNMLQVVNARVKKALEEGLEVHVDEGTYVETFQSDEEFLRIVDLKENSAPVNVKGEVASKPVLRDVKTFRQELVRLASFELKDETGKVWITAWRKHADMACNLKVGDKIIVKGAHAKKGFGDQIEISTREATSIMIVDKPEVS
jgi:DNA polymerase III alpha subunit